MKLIDPVRLSTSENPRSLMMKLGLYLFVANILVLLVGQLINSATRDETDRSIQKIEELRNALMQLETVADVRISIPETDAEYVGMPPEFNWGPTFATMDMVVIDDNMNHFFFDSEGSYQWPNLGTSSIGSGATSRERMNLSGQIIQRDLARDFYMMSVIFAGDTDIELAGCTLQLGAFSLTRGESVELGEVVQTQSLWAETDCVSTERLYFYRVINANGEVLFSQVTPSLLNFPAQQMVDADVFESIIGDEIPAGLQAIAAVVES